jgi:hypothetical protein
MAETAGLMTEADVATLLNCSRQKVRRLPIKGTHLRQDRKRDKRYTRDEVNKYLRSIGVKPCQSENRKTRHTTTTTSSFADNDFAGALARLPSVRRKPSSEQRKSADVLKLERA